MLQYKSDIVDITYRFLISITGKKKIIYIMSHFTKIKTKLYNLEILKKSLTDLNILWSPVESEVRGYKGQTHAAELMIAQENNHDIGFKWNGKEYELVTDLMFWDQEYSVVKFLDRVSQRYAFISIVEVSETEGFNFTHAETREDSSVRLVLRRFN
jgi:hypothetical protein